MAGTGSLTSDPAILFTRAAKGRSVGEGEVPEEERELGEGRARGAEEREDRVGKGQAGGSIRIRAFGDRHLGSHLQHLSHAFQLGRRGESGAPPRGSKMSFILPLLTMGRAG